MPLSQQQLEEKVIFLEQEMNQVKKILSINVKKTVPWWEEITGTFADNLAFEEAVELGNQYRQSEKSH
ncbi:hypothetical protein [Planktothrix mougeotii]|uniref:Uncharacterized protein n=1 Tax=Planktothrix mougeotii LEGE 06226 TaxID=1828728 RepID=A0ABR9UJX4_9CYAN|nr:hypothetical protein [Planktothrix mougeotii]MBE9146767.1 hypothetical protein [Planktothrix mougeotii LEGE 06226]